MTGAGPAVGEGPRRALVTGGTGFAGRHLVDDLLADGYAVRVLSRSAGAARSVLPAAVEIVEGDIADPAVAEPLVEGCDVVYHLAASFNEPAIPEERYRMTHVDGTRLLLEAARSAGGLRRFVHCSTVGVVQHISDPPADESIPHDPGDVYQATKSEAERLALRFQREHGFPLTVIRPTPIYGPGDRRLLKLFRLIDRGLFVMLGRGEVRLHLVHVADLVRGMRLAAERAEAIGEVFILGGDEAPTLNELVARIAELLDAPRPRWHLPVRPFYLLGAICEGICQPLGIEPPIYRRRVGFFMHHREFTIQKARRILGYEPSVDLETGLRETIEWYRERGYLRPAQGLSEPNAAPPQRSGLTAPPP